jgi:hypothetical protein
MEKADGEVKFVDVEYVERTTATMDGAISADAHIFIFRIGSAMPSLI